jgi:hypothetical protein
MLPPSLVPEVCRVHVCVCVGGGGGGGAAGRARGPPPPAWENAKVSVSMLWRDGS